MERDKEGQVIDYADALTEHLKIVPEGDAGAALAQDYAATLADNVMVGDTLCFPALLGACEDLKARINNEYL